MPEIAVNRFTNTLVPVIEDGNPNKNRIFINGQTFDKTTLAPYWMQNWHFNSSDAFITTGVNQQWGSMILSKGTIQCHATGDNTTFACFTQDTYHTGLDTANYPAKKVWRTANGKHYYAIPYGDSGNNNADSSLYNYSVIFNDDVLTGAFYNGGSWSTYPANFFYEDVANNKMWGMLPNNVNNQRMYYWSSYESGYTNYTAAHSTIGYTTFFMGVDNSGWIYMCQVATGGTNLYNYYQIYKFNPVSGASTQLITNSWRSLAENFRKALPSNIRRATADRRVFYSSHHDSSNVFAPIRYVFDAAAGTVTATNCTVNYAGADTYATHAEKYTLENGSGSGFNTYFMKGYQFTVSGTNYITFWICDMASTLGSSALRWNTDKKRTMLTFTIGSGTGDDVLTYHSKVTFPGVNAIPRNFMPINEAGTHVVVPVAGACKFYTFNTSTGWEQTGTYGAEFRQLGLDSTNRLWGTSTERGFNTIHTITPSTPVTVSVVMASPSYTYTGTNIATTAVVNAYDSNGARVVASINLTIEGSTMLFTSNSTKNLTVSTSSSADTTVSLTISGGGVNNIVASVNF